MIIIFQRLAKDLVICKFSLCVATNVLKKCIIATICVVRSLSRWSCRLCSLTEHWINSHFAGLKDCDLFCDLTLIFLILLLNAIPFDGALNPDNNSCTVLSLLLLVVQSLEWFQSQFHTEKSTTKLNSSRQISRLRSHILVKCRKKIRNQQ